MSSSTSKKTGLPTAPLPSAPDPSRTSILYSLVVNEELAEAVRAVKEDHVDELWEIYTEFIKSNKLYDKRIKEEGPVATNFVGHAITVLGQKHEEDHAAIQNLRILENTTELHLEVYAHFGKLFKQKQKDDDKERPEDAEEDDAGDEDTTCAGITIGGPEGCVPPLSSTPIMRTDQIGCGLDGWPGESEGSTRADQR